MNLTHKNIELIEAWLTKNDISPTLSDSFVRHTYDCVLEQLYKLKDTESIKKRNRAYKLQYDFVRRDLLKIMHKRNGYSAKGISAGYVYAITNPAWNDYIKIGSAIDVNDRLNSYQTSSPLRDYTLLDYYFVYDRRNEESVLHSMFPIRNSEWCKTNTDEIKDLFKKNKSLHNITVTQEKLYEVKRKLMR